MKSTFKWSLMLTSLALSSAIAIAQPAPPPPPGNNPPPNARPPRPNHQRMTPEERRKETEDKMREMMTSNGVTDATTQDAVLAYLANELESRKPLRQMGVKLQRALSDKDVTDDQIKAMIADYQNAQALDQQRHVTAQNDLDTKIHYSQNPRLQGFLMLMGVLGDGPPMMRKPHPPRAKGKRGGNPEARQKMLKMFDKDGDGKLNAQEKAAMQAYLQQRRANKKDGNQAPPPPPPPDNN